MVKGKNSILFIELFLILSILSWLFAFKLSVVNWLSLQSSSLIWLNLPISTFVMLFWLIYNTLSWLPTLNRSIFLSWLPSSLSSVNFGHFGNMISVSLLLARYNKSRHEALYGNSIFLNLLSRRLSTDNFGHTGSFTSVSLFSKSRRSSSWGARAGKVIF